MKKLISCPLTFARLTVVPLVLVSALAGSRPGLAGQLEGEDPFSDPTIGDARGAFTYSVSFDLPAYNGLEPPLGLVYNSGLGNGIVGVGWRLSGLSQIDRTSKLLGAPEYLDSDLFRLDGDLLRRCPSSGGDSIASCSAGGTHYTERESFLRITQSGGDWTVDRKDGTTLTYGKRQLSNGGQTFRWYLSTVQRKGYAAQTTPTVNFEYSCDRDDTAELGHDLHCYLSRVTYGAGTDGLFLGEVIFHYESRTDVIPYGTGDTTASHGSVQLGVTRLRLSAVEIMRAGASLAGYLLEYADADSAELETDLSRLVRVRNFGRDAVFDEGGQVTGTELPPLEIGWYPARRSFGDGVLGLGPTSVAPQDWAPTDVNADGVFDVVYRRVEGQTIWANVSGPEGHGQQSIGVMDNQGQGTFEACLRVTSAGSRNVLRNVCERSIGDFNGDGRGDYGQHHLFYFHVLTGQLDQPGHNSTEWHYKGNRTVCSRRFAAEGGDDIRHVWEGDFNGDGKTDLMHRRTKSSGSPAPCSDKLRVLISTGQDFSDVPKAQRPQIPHSDDRKVRVADVNGDGLSDLIWVDPENEVWVKLSHGEPLFNGLLSGEDGWFTEERLWGALALELHPKAWGLADVNGDSLADLVYFPKKEEGVPVVPRTLLSTGRSFGTDEQWADLEAVIKDAVISFGFINGDNMADVVYFTGNRAMVLESTGSSFIPRDWGLVSPHDRQWFVGDVSGDGAPDFVFQKKDGGTYSFEALTNTQVAAGLVANIDHGRGGALHIAYESSSKWDNRRPDGSSSLPVGMVFPTVSELRVDDGHGNLAATSFSYKGGEYDRARREFLGFREIATTYPCDASTECVTGTSVYQLDRATPGGRLEEVRFCDAGGQFLRGQRHEYVVQKTSLPFNAFNTSTWQHASEGGVACDDGLTSAPHVRQLDRCRVRSTNGNCDEPAYDLYGNVLQIIDHGDQAVTGDEQTTTIQFSYNEGDYLVDRLGRRVIVHANGTEIRQEEWFYDDASSWQTPPTRGLATQTRTHLDLPVPLWVSTTRSYDDRGNLKREIDPTGIWVEHTYDPVYGFFRTTTENGLGVSAHSEWPSDWNIACGQPQSTTDLNDNLTLNQYDAFCRPTSTETPANYRTVTHYCELGAPAEGLCDEPTRRFIGTERLGPNGNMVWEKRFLDGLDRVYRHELLAPDADHSMTVTLTGYDILGRKAWESAPHYQDDNGVATEPVRTTHYRYDALGRWNTQTFSEGLASSDSDPARTRSYRVEAVPTTSGDLSMTKVESFDELGKRTVEYLNVKGQLLRSDVVDGGQAIVTLFAYDVYGNLAEIIDPYANSWHFQYDSLGRKIWESDPNRGVIQVNYDNADRPTFRLDDSGRVERYQYDFMGRLERITAEASDVNIGIHHYVYDQDRGADYANKGRLTSVRRESYGEREAEELVGSCVLDKCKVSYVTRTVTGMITTDSDDTDYDPDGRVVRNIRKIDGGEYPLERSFHPDGSLDWIRYPDGETVTYRYDDGARPIGIDGFVDNVKYTGDGRLQFIDYANNTETTLAYRPDRGWLETVDTIGTSTSLQSLTYTHYDDGRLKSQTGLRSTDAFSYVYDDRGRLKQSTNSLSGVQTYAYDAIDNLVEASDVGCYAYDEPQPHAVTRITGLDTEKSFGYDSAGRMKSRSGARLAYDAEGRLSHHENATMAYGNNGERFRYESADGTVHLYPFPGFEIQGGTVTKYISLAGRTVAKRTGSAATGADQTTTWFHTDGRNSVHVISDDQGEEIQRIVYKPYGQELSRSQDLEEPRNYIGERLDDTGLLYLNARYYDPLVGRFATPDPSDVTLAGVGLNGYAYSGNNPTTFSDPGGLNYLSDSGSLLDPISLSTQDFATPLDVIDLNLTLSAPDLGFAVTGYDNFGYPIYNDTIGAAYPFGPPASGVEPAETPADLFFGTTIAFGVAKVVRFTAPFVQGLFRRGSRSRADDVIPNEFDDLPATNPIALRHGNRLNQIPTQTLGTGRFENVEIGRVYNYVVDEGGNLRIALRGSAGPSGTKHTELTGGRAARAAGELKFGPGNRVIINSSSGRFRDQVPRAPTRVVEVLRSRGYQAALVEDPIP